MDIIKERSRLLESGALSAVVGDKPCFQKEVSSTVAPLSGGTGAISHIDTYSSSTDLKDRIWDLQVRWYWESDGLWDTEYSTVKSASHHYTAPGNYTIRRRLRIQVDWLLHLHSKRTLFSQIFCLLQLSLSRCLSKTIEKNL